MRVHGDTLTITLDTTSIDSRPVTRTLTWSRWVERRRPVVPALQDDAPFTEKGVA
jgi:hypothetical protein